MRSAQWELVRSFFRCPAWMNGYAHHGRPKNAAMKNVSRLEHLQNGAVLVLDGFGAVHRLMKMRIKLFAERIDTFDAKPRDVVDELLVNKLETFAIVFVLGSAMARDSILKTATHRHHPFAP